MSNLTRPTNRLENGDTVMHEGTARRIRRVAPASAFSTDIVSRRAYDVVFEGGDKVIAKGKDSWQIVGAPMTPDPEKLKRVSAGDYVTHDGMFCITGDGSDRLHGWNLWEGEEAHGTVLGSFDRVADARKCLARVRMWHKERVRQADTGREGTVELVTEDAQRRNGIIVTVAWDDGDRAAYRDPASTMHVIAPEGD